MKLLFKVEKVSATISQYDGSFRVKRICNDEAIMGELGVGVSTHVEQKVILFLFLVFYFACCL
jgi:hypothetical protein